LDAFLHIGYVPQPGHLEQSPTSGDPVAGIDSEFKSKFDIDWVEVAGGDEGAMALRKLIMGSRRS